MLPFGELELPLQGFHYNQMGGGSYALNGR